MSGSLAPVDDQGNVFAPGNAEAQTRKCLDIIAGTLEKLGLSMSCIVRTRLYVTHADDWPAIGRAHAAFFTNHPPAATLVEVSRLVDPAMLIEIEADAFDDTA